jgi:hypothetical protein
MKPRIGLNAITPDVKNDVLAIPRVDTWIVPEFQPQEVQSNILVLCKQPGPVVLPSFVDVVRAALAGNRG